LAKLVDAVVLGVPDVPLAVLGSALGSKGEEVLAPETPKTII
jgi:hypothetical protein